MFLAKSLRTDVKLHHLALVRLLEEKLDVLWSFVKMHLNRTIVPLDLQAGGSFGMGSGRSFFYDPVLCVNGLAHWIRGSRCEAVVVS
jgi:hypothetical protein